MSTRPKVSIVIPVFNHSAYLERCLESVLNQSYRPLEIIIIDDGYSDDSFEVAKRFVETHAWDAMLISRPNRGAHHTINQGVRLSSGSYINVLNSDDEFHPHRIEECVAVATNQGENFIFTGVDFIDDNGESVRDDYTNKLRSSQLRSIDYPTIGFALMRNQIAISTGNFFFSRQLFDVIGDFRSYKYVHDWDFILRSSFYCEPHFLTKELYRYRLHDTNSFKALSGVERYETTEVIKNFLVSMVRFQPLNQVAPSPHHWPGFFEWLIDHWNYHFYMPV